MSDAIGQKSLFHPVFTIWVPAGLFLIQVVMEIILPGKLMSRIVSENGPHEIAQFCIAFCAFIMAARAMMLVNVREKPFLFAWVTCFALGCFYIAAEEVSWGQTFIGWATPGHWAQINDQQETNLHNISSWLDQKPKMLVEIGILIGGLIFPLGEKYKWFKLPEQFRIIYPPISMLFIVLCVIAVKLSDLVDEQLPNISLWTRDAEIEELYVFYYLLLYLIQLRLKILKGR